MSALLPAIDLATPRIRVVTLAELEHTPDGLTRGYAHVGLPDHPAHAPGHLDFAPLLLFASGENLPGERFEMHRHENIENVMLMLRGTVRHRDSQGGRCIVREDDVSVLSAGRGFEHEETVMGDVSVRALVIWLCPARPDGDPAFFHGTFARTERRGRWRVLAGGGAHEHALPLGCDAEVRATILARGETIAHAIAPGRRVYAIALDGAVEVQGCRLEPGERVIAEGEGALTFLARAPAELVLVDMACRVSPPRAD